MFSPPAIQLRPLLVGQLEFAFALGFGQTLPKCHRQFGSIASWEFQKLSQRT